MILRKYPLWEIQRFHDLIFCLHHMSHFSHAILTRNWSKGLVIHIYINWISWDKFPHHQESYVYTYIQIVRLQLHQPANELIVVKAFWSGNSIASRLLPRMSWTSSIWIYSLLSVLKFNCLLLRRRWNWMKVVLQRYITIQYITVQALSKRTFVVIRIRTPYWRNVENESWRSHISISTAL